MRPCKLNVFLVTGLLITALFTLSSKISAFTLISAHLFRGQMHVWHIATGGASLTPEVDNLNARGLSVARSRMVFHQSVGRSLDSGTISIAMNAIRFKETQPNLRNPEQPLDYDVELQLGVQAVPINPTALALNYLAPKSNQMPVVLTRTGPDQKKQSVRAYVKYDFDLPLNSSSRPPIFNLILTIEPQATYPRPMVYTISLAPRYIQFK